MKATILALLLLGGSASAVKLYMVTVKTSQVFPHMYFVILPKNKAQEQYGILTERSSIIKKLPAGQYIISVFQHGADIESIDTTQQEINVTKNEIFVIQLNFYPLIDPIARQVWNRLLIDMQATEEPCAKQTIGNSCAQTAALPITVKSFIGRRSEFVQLEPWLGMADGAIGRFKVNGVPYDLVINQNEGGSSVGIGRDK